jgi:hypothetical protein
VNSNIKKDAGIPEEEMASAKGKGGLQGNKLKIFLAPTGEKVDFIQSTST